MGKHTSDICKMRCETVLLKIAPAAPAAAAPNWAYFPLFPSFFPFLFSRTLVDTPRQASGGCPVLCSGENLHTSMHIQIGIALVRITAVYSSASQQSGFADYRQFESTTHD